MRCEMRMRLEHRRAQLRASELIGQRCAEHVRQRAQDRPVLARVARREARAVGHLHAAFGVDVDAGFFRIGGARQDDVGAMRAAVAMACRYRRRRRPARPRSRRRRAGTATSSAPGRHLRAASCRPRPARSRYRARRRATPRCAAREKPFQPSFTAPSSMAAFAASAATAAPSARAQRACADDDQRTLGALAARRQSCACRRRARPASPARRRDSRKDR